MFARMRPRFSSLSVYSNALTLRALEHAVYTRSESLSEEDSASRFVAFIAITEARPAPFARIERFFLKRRVDFL